METQSPEHVVTEFLDALASNDSATIERLLADDVVYVNVSLPSVRGRARVASALGSLFRPGRLGFDVRTHYLATDGDMVLTDRTDEIAFGRFAARFWVYGRFEVRDGRITLWRDAFDWYDLMLGFTRGALGVVVPAFNRTMPSAPAPVAVR
ncbi:SnoaL-like domain-containing protein [Rhodococcus sp. HNM0569]|nr:SnoaL-like domain-containing protein [Rhodococcus sp. HNM0569]